MHMGYFCLFSIYLSALCLSAPHHSHPSRPLYAPHLTPLSSLLIRSLDLKVSVLSLMSKRPRLARMLPEASLSHSSTTVRGAESFTSALP